MMTNIQIRLDKLRYWWGFSATARDGIVGQAASDGFNTVSIPIHWYEVEPTKNNFNWTILDEYLGLCQKYGLKMELLWFGANSGGYVQWLGNPNDSTYTHLRTPDYVLYSPAPGSSSTTSDYTINRTAGDYSLDLTDVNYRNREAYVLGQVMAHIASWDAANGNPHTVIGVQINNEIAGRNGVHTPAQIMTFASGVAAAVKSSSYVVWTRVNCLPSLTAGRVDANEALRNSSGTNVDFAGIDRYPATPETVQTAMPDVGRNYKMIMEVSAAATNAGLLPMAALSGDTALDYYDMLSPDGNALYDRSGTEGWTPNGTYITDVRTVNRLISGARYDLALKKKQPGGPTGLYVHNYKGDSTAATSGVTGVSFTPSTATSQGVSVVRSSTEVLLINTKGGTFTYPSSLGVTGASRGYFDGSNVWVNEGSVSYSSTSITPPVGTIVRLMVTSLQGSTTFYEAESLTRTLSTGVTAELWDDGASGGTWVKILSDSTGDYVEFTVNVPSTGNYYVMTGYRSGSNRGIAQMAINGSDFGSAIDMYQVTATFKESWTPVTFGSTGNKTFRYRVTGKNASSTDYSMGFDYIKLKKL